MKTTVALAITLFILIVLVFVGMASKLTEQKIEIESLNAQMGFVVDEYNKLNHENKKLKNSQYLDGTCLPRIPRFEKGTV